MKKIFCLLLTLSMVLALAACGGSSGQFRPRGQRLRHFCPRRQRFWRRRPRGYRQ